MTQKATRGEPQLVSVDLLWKANRHSVWDLTDDHGNQITTVSLRDVLRENVRGIPEEAEGSLESIFDRVGFWAENLEPYAHDKEESEIPIEWAIEVDMANKRIEDGHHRLVAAKLVGLEKLLVLPL